MTTVVRFLKSPIAILIAYGISLSAFGFAYQANTQQVKESKERAAEVERQNEAIERQSERLQVAFCGIVEPYAASPQPPTTPAAQR